MERLGMGMGRLGFGQVGGAAKPAATPKKMGGFGSTSRAVDEGTHTTLSLLSSRLSSRTQKSQSLGVMR